MKHWLSYLAVVAIGCGTGVHSNPGMPPDAGPSDAPPGGDAGLETRVLSMNDISMMQQSISFDSSLKMTGIERARDLVPRALYARLATSHGDIVNDYEEYEVFGLRFDLCDRMTTGPCPESADGSLRVVFQPGLPRQTAAAADVGLHAFYTIPAAELGFVVNELRAIARLNREGRTDGPLGEPSNTSIEGRQRLHALLDKYLVTDRIIRLALMGQDQRSSTPHVVFRAIEHHGDQWDDMEVAGTGGATQQDVELSGADPSYAVTPLANAPGSFALTLTSAAFNAAAPAAQREALDALVAAENPRLHTSTSVQCIACHVSTYLGVHRAQVAVIGLGTLPSRFETTRDIHGTPGSAAISPASLHNFGWLGTDVMIAQRAANETAVVLDEIEQRFPAATP